MKLQPDGKFVVRRRGSLFDWFAKDVTLIPNFFVLQDLIERHATIERIALNQ